MKKVVLLLAACVVLAAGGSFSLRWWTDNRTANFSKTSEIYVYPEMTASEVLDLIASEAGVKNLKSLERTFESKKVHEYLQPGHYTISPGNSSVYVARMLNNAWQTPVKLTLAGNLRIKSNIAAKISSQLLLDSASVHAALNNDSLLSEYGFDSKNVFSLLFPATYEVYWTASVKDLLDRQKQSWDAFWTEENDAKAKALGLNRKQVSILASIVKGESNHVPEMPKIAGVYLNRLKVGMPLQADPTVAYCFDYKLNRVLNRHLEVDSPYNTYKHAGLPPGPICVPTKAALEAVLNPDFGGEWGRGNFYFCANPDFSGTHVFARTLTQHNANADAFRRELNRRSRARR